MSNNRVSQKVAAATTAQINGNGSHVTEPMKPLQLESHFWEAAEREAWKRGSEPELILREILHVHFYQADAAFKVEANRRFDSISD